MKTETMKWLRLELEDSTSLPSMYLIFQTHYSMYSYLQDQGYTINIFHPVTSGSRDEENVVFVQTNHKGFFESCLKNYARDFEISGLSPGFEPSRNHLPLFGGQDLYLRASGM